MIDEVQDQIELQPVVEEVSAVEALPEVERSEEENLAMSKGWKPDYEGVDKIDAGEFLRREPLFGKIADLSRKQRETEKVLRETIEYNRKLAERERVKELTEIQARRTEAVELGDTEAFAKVDEEYQKKIVEPAYSPNIAPELSEEDKKAFKEFQDKNGSWANRSTPENVKMLTAADQIYELLLAELPGKTTKEYLKLTEEKVKAVFSHKFQNVKKEEPQAVSGGGRVSSAPSNLPKYDALSSLQKHQCDLFVKSGGTRSEYITQLKKLGRV